MLEEPASSITDFALALVALAAFVGLQRDGRAHAHWRRAFALIAIAGLLGGIHHGFVVRNESIADVSWAVISMTVAVALSFILAASAANVLGEGRGGILMAVRYVSLLAFAIVAVLGYATVTTLVITEAMAMAMVLGLWLHAWRLGQPGVGMFFAAIAASAFAGGVKGVTPEVVVAGWTLDPATFYHVAQLPGLAMLYVAILRRADAAAPRMRPERSTLLTEA